jgi:hypothetical protein
MRPTVFLDGFFRIFAAPSVRDADELALPMGRGKTSPISAVDVARAVSVVLDDPAPHIGEIYNLTGFESAEVVQGDLTDLTAMHRAIEGCARVYFGTTPAAPVTRIGLACEVCAVISTDIREIPGNLETRIAVPISSDNGKLPSPCGAAGLENCGRARPPQSFHTASTHYCP